MSGAVEIERLTVRFGDFAAVDNISLEIASGEFFSILGPSGCGKTTILRTLSGFQTPSSGNVRIGGSDVASVGPNKRPTALIFQNLALFPLMSVAENVAYGLRVRGVASATRKRKAQELLDLVALPGVGAKKISELSGGQRQRVAIARALAVEPKVLLLDEPLSALDLRLRQHMRTELREIQKRVGITFVYITHDQGEALSMSDRVAVMNRGRIEQIGDARGIYETPRTPFVASFVGETNALSGRVLQIRDGIADLQTSVGLLQGRTSEGLQYDDDAILYLRPERLKPAETGLPALVQAATYEGPFTHFILEAVSGHTMKMSIGAESGRDLMPGASVKVSFTPEDAVVLKCSTEA